MWEHSGKVAIVGLGHSPIFRNDDGTPQHRLGALAEVAVTAALADAGLQLEDIDGISTAPHQPFEGASTVEGIGEVSSKYLIEGLGPKGMKNVQWTDDSGGLVGHAIINAIQGVASGKAKVAIATRSMHNPRGIRYGHGGANAQQEISGPGQFSAIYGTSGPANFAQVYQRYLWKYNQKREKMATLAVHERKYGLWNENSFWKQNRPTVLTRQDYLDARMIAEPLCLFDCDLPVQAAACWLVTTAERARDLRQKPAYILGTALTQGRTRSTVQKLEESEDFAAEMGRKLKDVTGTTAKDWDIAEMYDGFLCIAPVWSEGCGVCKPGEFLDFIQDGRIEADGASPLNVSGGNNGNGRVQGIPMFYNPVEQIRGTAGKRQVKDAKVIASVMGPFGAGQGIVYSASPS